MAVFKIIEEPKPVPLFSGLKDPDNSVILRDPDESETMVPEPHYACYDHLGFSSLPIEQQQQLSGGYFRTAYGCQAAIVTSTVNHDFRIAEMDYKAKIDEKKDKRKEQRQLAKEEREEQRQIDKEEREVQRKLNKESETLRCTLTDAGIEAQIRNPQNEGTPFVVVSCPGVKLTKLISVTPSGEIVHIFRLSWLANSEGVYIGDEVLEVDGFVMLLRKCGISLNTSRRNHKSIVRAAISKLIESGYEEEIPFGFGWHKNLAGEWRFITSDEGTFLKFIGGVKHV